MTLCVGADPSIGWSTKVISTRPAHLACMADSDLAARLTAHEHAFDGLLDLIPAKFYNPEDAANQWSKRKQTKEEAVNAKRAKLDPDQNARHKRHGATQTETVLEPSERAGASVRSTKQDAGHKSGVRQTKIRAKKEHPPGKTNNSEQSALPTGLSSPSPKESDNVSENLPLEVENVTSTGKEDRMRTITDIRARLVAKIEALQSKRKAPGSGADGAPKSRNAILEARRKKEETRRERTRLEREARKDAELEIKSDEEDLSDEAVAAELDMSSDGEDADASISYGKLAFADGEQLNPDGSVNGSRKRRQQDAQSALQAALNKKARLSALPVEKQAKITDSDTWHKALLQADGEKVKDDVALLKKAVKRKEGLKKKSTKEWKERLSSIAKAKALKQKNREKNLADRKNSKGVKGGHKKGKQIGAFQGKKKTKSGF